MRTAAKSIFWLLLGVVVLSPLPFASNRPWSWSLLAALIGALLIAWSLALMLDRSARTVSIQRIWPMAALFAVAIGWAFVQTAGWVPSQWHNPFWQDASRVLEGEVNPLVTLDPHETGTALMRLLSYGGVFWLALQYCQSADRARQVFYAISIAGLAYAAYGLVIQITGSKTILWYDKWAYHDDVTSTFVNRNSYATYAGLGLMCALGLLVDRAVGESARASVGGQAIGAVLSDIAKRTWPLVLAAAAMLVAVLLSHSRGGFLSAGIGIVTLILGAGFARSIKRRYTLIAGALVVIAGVGALSLVGDSTLARLQKTSLANSNRDEVYLLTSRAIADDPLLGKGYGTYESVFRIIRDDSVYGTWRRAHNTYLENALELGIPAAAALTGAIGGLSVLCFFGIRRRQRNAMYPAIGLAATALVGAHSLVDFSLQMPAVAVTYAMIMGAACAQSWPESPP